MSTYPEVIVEDAPGYCRFEGNLILTTPGVDGRGELSAVIDADGSIAIVPSVYVTQVTPT